MKIHYIQHVPFETPAYILTWAKEKGYGITSTHVYRNSSFPETNSFDWLVIMGGPMNIYQEKEYPWLIEEKKFISKAIKEEKTVLGICLGAQLIADVLGAKIYRNAYKEIGWFPVNMTNEGLQNNIFSHLPKSFTAFHWHGDTFDLPSNSLRLASSEGCLNQAFLFGNKTIGLQFHLEATDESLKSLVENCSDELTEGKYIQDAQTILTANYTEETKKLLYALLDRLAEIK